MLVCDKAQQDIGAPVDVAVKEQANRYIIGNLELDERYRKHVPYATHNVMMIGFPHCLSEGANYFVPKIKRYHLTEDNVNRLKYDPVDPSPTALQKFGYSTNTWEPTAFEHLTLVYGWEFDARIDCWYFSYPNDIETVWVIPISLGTHPGLTVVAPSIMAK